MNITKRIVALFICAMMLVTVFPVGVFAAEEQTEETEAAETASEYRVLHGHLDFEDIGTTDIGTYTTNKLAGTGLSHNGSKNWSAVTEDGNTYLSAQDVSTTGYSILGADFFTNQSFELSFKVRLSYNSETGTGSVFFPLVRISPDGEPSTGTTNLLAIETPKSGSREEDTLMGTLVYTKSDGTNGKTTLGTGHKLYADTWYTFRVVYDNADSGNIYSGNYTSLVNNVKTTVSGDYALGQGYVYMTEEGGSEKPLGAIYSKSMDTIKNVLMGRGYTSTFLNIDIDDVTITSVEKSAVTPVMDTYTDFESLTTDSSVFVDADGLVVESTTEGAVNAVSDTSFNATAGLNGLTMASGSMTYNSYYPWYVATESNGNKYLAKLPRNRSLNLEDTANVLKDGKFEISFDLLPGETMKAGGILSLKDASSSNSATSTTGESRILSVQSLTDGYNLTLGKTTTFPIYKLTAGEWVHISVTVDPTTSDYEIWVNGELILYTRIDLTKTTESEIYHKVWLKGAWNPNNTPSILSTNASYPFDTDLAEKIKYVYFFHSYDTCPIGIDNLRVRTLEDAPAANKAKADGTLYSMNFAASVETLCADCWTGASNAGLVGISASPVPTVTGGALVNTAKGSSRTELAISTDAYTYLEGGVLCIEGKITPNAFSGNSGEFVFAALNRYTSASNVASAKLVTVAADGKVSVGNKTGVATLTTGTTHTIKVYVDTETMLATLFVDGVRKAINAELETDLLLAPVIDTRDILVPAIGEDGCVITAMGNSSESVADYIRFDYGNTPAVLDTVVLFDSTVNTDTWGFKADDVAISFTSSVDDANIDLDFESDIINGDIVTDGAVAADGVLTVSDGGSLTWNDSNLDMVSWLADRGFAVELKLRASAAADGTKPIVQMFSGSTSKTLLAIDSEGKIVVGSSAKYPVADPDADGYTAIQLVFSAGTTKAGIYADGKLLGNVDHALNYMSINQGGLRVLGEVELDELKIHSTLVRDYAKQTGNIFDIDAAYYTPSGNNLSPGASNGSAPSDGVIAPGSMTTLIDPTAENGETRSFLRRTGTSTTQTDIFATGHLSDTVTVLEATIRNTVPGTSSSATDIFRVRKGTYNGSDFIYLLYMNNGTGNLYFKSNGTTYYLCDKDGNIFSANSETEWTTVAVVYDAIAATVRYTVNNQFAYCKTSTADGAPIGFADGYQVNQLDWNSLVAEETRVRLYVTSGTGTLDVARYRAYEIDASATAEIVGAQWSASGNSLRIIAGVDMLHYGTVGFKVEYFDANGKAVGEAQYVDGRNVFLSLNGGGETWTAEDLGYRYLTAVTVTDIGTRTGSYRITPFTTLGGIGNNGSAVYYGTPYTVVSDETADEGLRYLETTTPIADAIYDTSEVVQFRGDGLNFNGIDAVFTFSAVCEGDVSISLVTARQLASVNSSTFELWVDGVRKDNIVLEIGHHSLTLAEGLASGEHTFKLVKKTGGDYAHVYDITLNGTFTDTATAGRKNGVMLEVAAPEAGEKYGNFYVYTQTSDPTGDYYIKYNFIYELDDSYPEAANTSKSNTGYNRSNYRIREAYLVKYDESTATFTNVWRVLHQGEISLAIKETNESGIGLDDFIGGYHGDERLESVELFMDGVEVDLTKSSSLQTCSKLIFKQTTILNTSDKPLQNVLRHIQNYVIDSSGIRNRQQVEILSDSFRPMTTGQVYLQMFTYYRTSGDTILHDTVNFLDATGSMVALTAEEIAAGKLNTFKASEIYTAGEDKRKDGSVNSRYMEYIGANDNGLYGKVGFNITDHSVTVSSISTSIRQYNDVKWYPSFIGRKTTPVKGEVWSADLYYVIDYVNPDNVIEDVPVVTPEGTAPATDVAITTGTAAAVINTEVDYDTDGSYEVVIPNKTCGIALKQVLDLDSTSVGKTYEITAYVYPETEEDTTAVRLAVVNSSLTVADSSYHFVLTGNAWNKVTMLYEVESANDCWVLIDQDTTDALSAVSSDLCTTFYVDGVSATEYVATTNSKYTVYSTQGFENSPTAFSKYSVDTYAALTAEDDEYMTGGRFSGITKVGALNWNAHSGDKALTVYPFGLYNETEFSGRIKLSNLLPNNIDDYKGRTIKVSAYIMMDDMSAGDGTSIKTYFGVMSDGNTTQNSRTAVTFAEGVWTYAEHEFVVTDDILTWLGTIDGEYYPARVYLNFGGASNYPGVVYIDDITVEIKDAE